MRSALFFFQTLVDVYSMQKDAFRDKQFKLLCTPLNPSQSKSLEIAVNKLNVWWFLLCKVSGICTNRSSFYKTALLPYLVFCFGKFVELTPEDSETTETLSILSVNQSTSYS